MTRIAARELAARARARSPSTSTNSGPPKGSRAREHELGRPGRIPRSAEVAQHPRVAVGDPAERRRVSRLELAQGDRRPRRRASSSALGDRVAVRVAAGVAELRRRSAPRGPRRCSARAPRPRRGPGPRASRGPRRGRTRAAGGGGSPRAPPARRPAVSADAAVGLVLDQAELVHPLEHRGHGPRRDAEPLGERRGRRPGPRSRRASA